MDRTGGIPISERGHRYYDEEDFLKAYLSRRSLVDNANDTLEKPVMLELIGNPEGLRILDLGCGDARFGAELLERNCASYTGLEGSKAMSELARRTLAGTAGTVILGSMEDWSYPQASCDLVLSRLALHYVEHLEAVLARIVQSLKPGGRLVFSVEHPVITSTLQPSGTRTDWTVDRYFDEGFREQQWLGSTVKKMHRTLEHYFSALQAAGLQVESLRESNPVRERFHSADAYERRRRIPLFLFFSASRPSL
ncbi:MULTISPECIES: class I SAM-dependent methyltransferase [unclassified Paenibacillus]|uniref:class I SAM-dependent methyltransferase n=1 Tax=unclassified Paenibacillus TaxID=185978 RepID=UPI000953D3E0|nr:MULTISPECIES: class I SAM-dependent methyltransferase [unclassified Paenibacillus]SIQ34396.1 Methyltransferase domain-containing protein [Paenibacillus sp. RU4X]SIQ56182.1 Methyltransferase domain-containing protein [Paenibacillus sp. RU4T]